MRLILIVGLAVVIAIVIYVAIHHEITKHATLIVRRAAQENTDEAMRAVLPTLEQHQLLQKKQIQFSSSQTVADVWGRGVMAFEYILPKKNISTNELELVTKLLNEQLEVYSQTNQVKRVKESNRAFIVTDTWLFEGKLHLDIAYLMNEATYEYVRDLKRID
ncbi:hypothetical protein [Paucilactobacillus kaifaensis]|uniref:hypothetical protein n=1 Tax=Paucilactobacillus kaifaensis TaxID=2559921 RepID=UPI0010F64D52|nr:hypothetical protein [Paucilactobacillus kaifaensis]